MNRFKRFLPENGWSEEDDVEFIGIENGKDIGLRSNGDKKAGHILPGSRFNSRRIQADRSV
jgi:hypothetical protein